MLFWAGVRQCLNISGNVGPRQWPLRLPDGSICQNMLFSKIFSNMILILQIWRLFKSIVALKCLLLHLWLSLSRHRHNQSGCKRCLSPECSCNFMLWKSLKFVCFNWNDSISSVRKSLQGIKSFSKLYCITFSVKPFFLLRPSVVMRWNG